ncbi:hypothetical protein AVEN_21790-1 [Araneus ventricosus]|uniref:Uncharacterized protein n=1 Tax=Araneus ventricosus TaxID=182803 RepID=A0A4Y2V2E9_ARAVE|nr:hypothetical protein AVEN_28686-1 [Araneus ventricosus]GBO18060.1 hypothetical protein AVEN_21790-1 [Araneus ventricosus]
MKLRLSKAQSIAVIHHRDYYSQALAKGLLKMSKRYRGRYLTTRLCKRSLNSSDPPKGCYYSIRQLTKGASLAKDLATVAGSIKRPFHQSSDSANQQHGVAPRVFTSQLSSLPFFSDRLPFLNTYP